MGHRGTSWQDASRFTPSVPFTLQNHRYPGLPNPRSGRKLAGRGRRFRGQEVQPPVRMQLRSFPPSALLSEQPRVDSFPESSVFVLRVP